MLRLIKEIEQRLRGVPPSYELFIQRDGSDTLDLVVSRGTHGVGKYVQIDWFVTALEEPRRDRLAPSVLPFYVH